MQQKVLLVGNVMITELLPTARIQTIFYVDDDALQYLKIENETRLVQVTAGVMAKITGLESVGLSTLAAEAVLPKPASFKSWQPGRMKRLLVLEGCQDPGNMVGIGGVCFEYFIKCYSTSTTPL